MHFYKKLNQTHPKSKASEEPFVCNGYLSTPTRKYKQYTSHDLCNYCQGNLISTPLNPISYAFGTCISLIRLSSELTTNITFIIPQSQQVMLTDVKMLSLRFIFVNIHIVSFIKQINFKQVQALHMDIRQIYMHIFISCRTCNSRQDDLEMICLFLIYLFY